MRKPPWWVRSVFQCSLCTRLCASWWRGFVWLRKHKVTRQTPVTFPWEVYLQWLANAERPFVIAETVVSSVSFPFSCTTELPPKPPALWTSTPTWGCVCVTGCRWRFHILPHCRAWKLMWAGEGCVWSDTWPAPSDPSWTSWVILQLCALLSVFSETLNPLPNQVGECRTCLVSVCGEFFP